MNPLLDNVCVNVLYFSYFIVSSVLPARDVRDVAE